MKIYFCKWCGGEGRDKICDECKKICFKLVKPKPGQEKMQFFLIEDHVEVGLYCCLDEYTTSIVPEYVLEKGELVPYF